MTETDPTRDPFRWAILGTGPVSHKFAHGLAACRPAAKVHVVISRDADRGAAFAAQVSAPHVVERPADAIAKGAEALYIASPASAHAAHAQAALEAGLPILVEKPLADTAAAARRIANAARTAGLFAAEAVWTRFLPLMDAVREALAEGRLGTPRALTGSFCAATTPDPTTSLFDPARGGGALLHRGLYPISLARMCLGPIAEIEAAGQIGPTGVDEEAALLLTHVGGGISQVRASLVAGGTNSASLAGTGALLELAPPIWRPTGATLRRISPAPAMAEPKRFAAWRESRAGQRLAAFAAPMKSTLRPPERLGAPFRGNGYTHEAEAAAQAIRAGAREAPEMPLDESIDVLAAIDAARARIGHAP